MTENKCKSLENLLPITTIKLSHTLSPEVFESYRNELHHEMANAWPFRSNISDSTNQIPTTSKSTAHANNRDNDKDIVQKTFSHLQSNNLISFNHTGLDRKKAEINNFLIPKASKFSLDEPEQHFEWDIKAQEGIITYQLPDNLPDGLALHNKLQKLMKTDTIYLNDRRFWTTLENRFKITRKQNFYQNMQRLRQSQQQYEQELIAKGIMPYTTEEAIKQYAEQQRIQTSTDKIDDNTSNRKECLIDYLPSEKIDDQQMKKNEELDAFESDNVHPCLHDIFTDYQFQTKSGKEIGEKYTKDLHKAQIQIKTIFPKINQRDLIRQELEVVKTSEGLYAYSNHLNKQLSK